MLTTSDSQSLIDDNDARQNDVLAQLDELNQRIELLLNEVRPPDPDPRSIESQLAEPGELIPAINLGDPAAPISQSPAAA